MGEDKRKNVNKNTNSAKQTRKKLTVEKKGGMAYLLSLASTTSVPLFPFCPSLAVWRRGNNGEYRKENREKQSMTKNARFVEIYN